MAIYLEKENLWKRKIQAYSARYMQKVPPETKNYRHPYQQHKTSLLTEIPLSLPDVFHKGSSAAPWFQCVETWSDPPGNQWHPPKIWWNTKEIIGSPPHKTERTQRMICCNSRRTQWFNMKHWLCSSFFIFQILKIFHTRTDLIPMLLSFLFWQQ